MNINPTYPNFPIANMTPSTDSLRRDNVRREVIVQPTEVQKPAAEKGAASDFDKVKTPGQQNEQANLAENQRQADEDRTTIGERGQQEQQGQEQSKQGSDQQAKSEQDRDSAITQAELKQIEELKTRDAEVRAHEAAHANTAGVHGGSPTYTYQAGPDGKRYAVGGEVSVDLSRVAGDPRATIRKMQQVHAAALAPAKPSSQDLQVASTAMRIMAEAQQDLVRQSVEVNSGSSDDGSDVNAVRNATLDESERVDNDITREPTSASLKQDEEDNVENTVFAANQRSTLDTEEQPVDDAVFATETNERPESVVRRSLRIQNFYMNINYTGSQSYQVSA